MPSLKYTVTARLPSLLAWDCMYSMFSTPLMDSSRGAATVSAITLGLAPGYWARTTTEGGTTSGYSEMGSWKTDSTPARRMRMDSTPAKMGRSMKNLEMFMAPPQPLSAGLAARATPAVSRPPMETIWGATSSPGRTRCKPFTTMRSPALRPLSTTRRPSCTAPRRTSR